MCNCIEQLSTINSEKYPDLQVNTTFMLPFNNPEAKMIEVPEMYGTYQYKSKRKRIAVFPTYCPFCGKKYREDGK